MNKLLSATLLLGLQLSALLLDLVVAGGGDTYWSYDDVGSWYGACPSPESMHQSPIILSKTYSHQTEEFGPFHFIKYDMEGKKMRVENTGHTVKFEIAGRHRYTIKGGGLPGPEFELVQGHFHWGLTNTEGSEHIMDRVHYPMELHLVHYNTALGKTFKSALGTKAYDALAVLGIMFRIQEEDNPKLQEFTQMLTKVRKEKSSHDMVAFPPAKFLPRNTDMFYRYNGSLTTPSCLEVVVWTVFKEPVGISQAQLGMFRQLTRETKSGPKQLGNNYRPTQKLNDRTVLDVDTSRKYFTESSAGRPSQTAILMYVVTSCILAITTFMPKHKLP